MITIEVLLNKDIISIYRKIRDIPSMENTAGSRGYMITQRFETEAKYKAYTMAMEDPDEHED